MLRDPKTIPAGDIIISDPSLEPFFITQNIGGGYTVYEKVNRGKEDKPYLKLISYPSTFLSALKAVAKNKFYLNAKEDYTTIRSYVAEWEEITKEIATALKADL